jgi:carbonic anhydrase
MDTQENKLQSEQNNSLTFSDYLELSLLKTELRTGKSLINIQETILDIHQEFKNLGQEKIIKAIRNGSLGLYGLTYSLSTQQVCIWIREYLKPSKSSTGAL